MVVVNMTHSPIWVAVSDSDAVGVAHLLVAPLEGPVPRDKGNLVFLVEEGAERPDPRVVYLGPGEGHGWLAQGGVSRLD